jgi:hypothetical protein
MRGHDGNGPAAAGRAAARADAAPRGPAYSLPVYSTSSRSPPIFSAIRRHGPDPARTARRPPSFPDCGWFHTWPAMPGKGRVRARKLRQRRWRCVTGAADRRRRDRRLCPCQLRAGELCARRGKAPVLICSGAASRRGLPYGGSTRFHGGSTRWQGHLGRFTGLRLRSGTGERQREAVTVLPR